MKEQMERHYKEQAYNDASQKTMDHRRLQQTVSSRRTLMTMPRKIQRSIWRLNMRCPTYSQVTTRQSLRCRWCDEDYYSITEHWLRHCPAMMYWQELMMDRLNEHETQLKISIYTYLYIIVLLYLYIILGTPNNLEGI